MTDGDAQPRNEASYQRGSLKSLEESLSREAPISSLAYLVYAINFIVSVFPLRSLFIIVDRLILILGELRLEPKFESIGFI